MQELGHSMCQPLRGVLVWMPETLQGRGCYTRSLRTLGFAQLHECC